MVLRRNAAMSPATAAVATGLVLVLALASCIRDTRPTPTGEPMPIRVVLAHASLQGGAAATSPSGFSQALFDELREAGFRPRIETAGPDLAAQRSTGARLSRLARMYPDTPVLLIETRTDFYTELEGRFRWTVATKASFIAPGKGGAAVQESFDSPAILNFPHHGPREALDYTARPIAREIAEQGGRFRDELQAQRADPGAAPGSGDEKPAPPARGTQPDGRPVL